MGLNFDQKWFESWWIRKRFESKKYQISTNLDTHCGYSFVGSNHKLVTDSSLNDLINFSPLNSPPMLRPKSTTFIIEKIFSAMLFSITNSSLVGSFFEKNAIICF